MNQPKAQEIYRHFKGNLYQIVTLAKHSETGEELVIYQALYGEYQVYARPLSMFMSPVDREKYPQTDQEYRFERVNLGNLGNPENHENSGNLSQNSNTEATRMENVEQAGTASGSFVSKSNLEPQAGGLPKGLMDFLDADSYEKRLEILTSLADQITNDMLTTMSVACDIELKDGSVEERFDELKGCLVTLEKYECNRLR